MPLRIAMPIAHVAGAAAYGGFYTPAPACIIRVTAYFNQGNPRCEGIALERDPAGPAAISADWDLLAFTDGFLSFQDNSLVLRLPLELRHPPAIRQYNSGLLFGDLRPRGPQLRHVVYRFPAAPPEAAVKAKLRTLLSDAAHPMRGITRVQPAAGGAPITLGAHLGADPGNLETLLTEIMAGAVEMFVRAGEIIGNFETQSVELRFLDSCGNARTNPAAPGGRPLNPAYYLSLLRLAGNNLPNARHVTMLTALVATPNSLAATHPLDHLLEAPRVTAAGASGDAALDLASATPAKPLHVHVDVLDAQANPLASTGIPMRGLGQWHQSRNAANPFSTEAPVRWRLRGNMPADADAAEYGCMITEAVAGRENRLPGPAAFDHEFAPGLLQTNRIQVYWTRYGEVFNAIGEMYDVPVELQVAIACAETSTGPWYNANFGTSHETDIIRMEPMSRLPNVITVDPGQSAVLTNYMNLTGGIGGVGANANLPIPWSGGSAVHPPNALTWNQLRNLINDYPGDILVSPGLMQVLVGTANGDLEWATDFYGAGFVNTITITRNGVVLTADNPPADLGDIFKDWFGVSVDDAGNNTSVVADVNVQLTKVKRALHCMTAAGAHIKRCYNTWQGGSNKICDLDLPTSFSGYNDGANTITAAIPTAGNNEKWKRLFAMTFYDHNYPEFSPRFYNAAVRMFNAPGVVPLPSIRMWRG